MKYCSAPFETVNIHSNGTISSCLCNNWHTMGFSMGKINDDSIENVFNNQSFIKFRESIIDQSFKHCNKTQCPQIWNLDQVDKMPYVADDKLLPKVLHLHLDQNCTLKCSSCRNVNIYQKEPNPKVVKILNNLTAAYMDYPHEVLVYADGYGDLFASTAYQNWLNDPNLPKCFKFCFTTNGNLISKNLNLIEKLKSQIDIIIVSLDAATADTYRKIRGGNFELLIQGIELLVSMGIKVTTQFVVQQKNYTEILKYVDLSKSLGISHIGLQKLDRWDHMSDQWWLENQLDNNSAVDLSFLISVLNKIKLDPQCGLCGGLESIIMQNALT